MNKQINVSIVRVIGCIMVVYFHCICFYTPTWTSETPDAVYTLLGRTMHAVDMPIFFLISGYLYSYLYNRQGKYRDVKSFLNGKVLRLMIPYLFWGFFICLVMPDRYQPINLLKGLSHLWFLLTLFNLFVITSIKRSFWTGITFKRVVIVTLASFAIFCVLRKVGSVGSWFCLSHTLLYLPVFTLGLWCGRSAIPHISRLKFAVACLLLLVLVCSGRHLLVSYSCIIGGGIALYMLYCFQNVKCIPQWMASIDVCSMGIYIIHHIIIRWMLQYETVSHFMLTHKIMAPALMFILVFPASWALTFCLRKIKHMNIIVG